MEQFYQTNFIYLNSVDYNYITSRVKADYYPLPEWAYIDIKHGDAKTGHASYHGGPLLRVER